MRECDGTAGRRVWRAATRPPPLPRPGPPIPVSLTHPPRGPAAARAALASAAVVALLAACNATSPSSRPTLGVNYNARGVYADRSLFSVEIRQGAQRRVIQGSQLTAYSQTGDFLSVGVEKLSLGVGQPVSVRVALASTPGDTAAAGTVTWTPQANYEYGVGAVAGMQRPAGFCFSIAHAIALPARGGTQGDTLFVTQSGIPRGAIC